MRVLVTGGAGFIGRYVAATLLETGHSVRIFDNFSSSIRGGLDAFDVWEGDIRDKPAVDMAMVGCDAVVHLAALVSVPLSLAEPELTRAINVQGFDNVLDAAVEQKIPGPFLYASSAAVYGNPQKQGALLEGDMNPSGFLSPYAESKYLNEVSAASVGVFPTVGLRFFNVYGPGQDPSSPYSGVLSKLVDAFVTKAPFTVLGDGEQTRDFVYVGDVASAVLGLLGTSLTGNKVLNVAVGESVTLNALMSLLENVMGRPLDVRRGFPAREGDVRYSRADVSALRALLPLWKARLVGEGLAVFKS